jgi:beta-lactamase regulating signal transducer with metallopeptidase domain
VIGWLISTLLGVTLLLAAVLLLRRPVARLFGAGWAYALWAAPAARLILPPLPFAPELGAPLTESMAGLSAVAAPVHPTAASGDWLPFLLTLWLAGAAFFLLWQWLSYRAFLDALEKDDAAVLHPLFRGIQVVESRVVPGPVAVGILRRRIVLPAGFFSRYSPSEQRLALQHEWVHHARGDLWWNFAAVVVLAFQWFNPLAHLAFRAFRMDQELACDSAVAAAASGLERHDYARALVKSASRPGLIAGCPLNGADQLKRRLRMMREHRVSRARRIGGALSLAALLPAVLVLSAPTFAAVSGDQAGGAVMVVRRLGAESSNFATGATAAVCEGVARALRKSVQGKVRTVYCLDGAANPEKRLKLLADARQKIGSDARVDDKLRARLDGLLEDEIEKARRQ